MKKIFKWTGIILGSLAGLLLIAYAAIYLNISSRMNERYSFPQEAMIIHDDSATLALGAHLVVIKGCTDCHGPNLAGRVMASDGALGTLSATNLTRGIGGLPDNYSTADWLMALRHGTGRDGRPLLLMPSHESALLREKDLAAIIAYCQHLPPVRNELPANKVGPVARILAFLGKMPLLSAERIDHSRPLDTSHAALSLISQGQYLAISCKGCHRDNMQGGSGLTPDMPEVPDITARGRSGGWSHGQFTTMLRSGKRPDGSQVRSEDMPWKMTAQYTDEEITALYTYLHSLK